jgi:hypothetical protein|nr:MAG TPA: hypothetical protein [Caudoviricetes sp.]
MVMERGPTGQCSRHWKNEAGKRTKKPAPRE